jgi:hypothetical protein
MQTFITSINIKETAKHLDQQRLGKQRVEAIQILNTLLGYSPKSSWKNHPAVKMWKGYEPFLVKVYLRIIMDEWVERGYKNEKCEEHYKKFMEHPTIKDATKIVKPKWLNSSFCFTHRSNLIRKKPEYYRPLWPATPDNLEYIWPV